MMRVWDIFILCIVVNSCIVYCASGAQATAEYQLGDSMSLLATKFTAALVNVTFDQDVFKVKTIDCPPSVGVNHTCDHTPISEYVCPPCDYTNRNGECGKSTVECPCNPDFCDTTVYQWVDVVPGVPVEVLAYNGNKTVTQLRYFHTEPCNGFKIKIEPYSGQVASFYSFINPSTEERMYVSSPDRATAGWWLTTELSFCPYDADIQKFQVGTLFFGIYIAHGFDSIVRVTVISEYISEEIPDSEVIVVSPDHVPLQDGVPYEGFLSGDAPDVHDYYTYTFSTCQVLSIRAITSAEMDIDLSISDDPSDVFPYYSGNWIADRPGDDYYTLSICPENPTTPKTLYIGVNNVNIYLDTWYRISVSSTAPKHLESLGSGTPFQTSVELIAAAKLTSPGLGAIGCSSFFECGGFYGIYPSDHPNMFTFLPGALLRNLLLPYPYVYDMDSNQVYHPEPLSNNRTFQAIALLTVTDFFSTQTMFNTSFLTDGYVSFTGLITDANFMPITGSFKLKPATPTCSYDKYNAIKSEIAQQLEIVQTETEFTAVLQARFNLDALTQFNEWTQCQEWATSFVEISTELVDVESDTCLFLRGTEDWINDPCCNSFLEWTTCCQPSYKPVEKRVVDGQSNRNFELADTECANPSCSLGIALSFAHAYEDIGVCSTPIKELQDHNNIVYDSIRDCTTEVFITTQCSDDVICQQITPNSFCDLQIHTCEWPTNYLETSFVKCVVGHLSSSLKISLATYLSVDSNANDTLIAAEFHSHVTQNDCILTNTSAIDLEKRMAIDLRTFPDDCGAAFGCDGVICKDKACIIEMDHCLFDCERFWRAKDIIAVEEECKSNDEVVCNWDACVGLNGTECTETCDLGPDSYCGFCLNQKYCAELVGVNVSDCSGSACLAPNNTLFTFTDESECTSIGTCVGCENCDSQVECDTTGVCSDINFVEPGGSCIVPPVEDLYYGGYPICFTTRFSPLGCINDMILDADSCTTNGGRWYTPATTKLECESSKRCYQYDVQYTLLSMDMNKRFTEKNEANCTCSGGEWISTFKWTPGFWIPGKVVSPSVIQKTLTPKYEWSPALAYYRVMDLLLDIAVNATVTAHRAEALCRFNKIKASLENVACDCTESGRANGHCYVSTPEVLNTLIRSCAGSEASFSMTEATITFPETSVNIGCTEVLIYDIAVQVFLASEPVRLAALFASFQPIEPTSIKNSNGGVIGEVLGDGIVAAADAEAKNVEICFKLKYQTNTKDYPVYDFASVDETYTKFTPLEIPTTLHNHGKELCAVVDIVRGDSIFIPVSHLRDWKDVERAYFSPSTRNMLLTLAVFYLVVAVVGFVLIMDVIIRVRRYQVATLITFTIFTFALIRCIYFFLVPTGNISVNASVAEYILIVLPTFPYFTAFSCIPAVWYTLLSHRQESKVTNMGRIIGIGNLILYLLFIFVVVVFNSTKRVVESQCLGQTLASTQLTGPQFAVSILYSVVISTISLAIASAFVFFGWKIASVTVDAKQTYKMACICAMGFALNCLFILIVTGAQLNNIAFSFVGLIITEIIPSVFILTNFGLLNSFIQFLRKRSGSRLSTSSTHSASRRL